MNLVCFDNNVLVWGVKEQATPGQEGMIPRTKVFIHKLQEDRIHVLIPSVVIAEFLMPIPPDMHATVINLFDRGFVVVPFDTAAASQFAKIWLSNKGQELVDSLIRNGSTRAELKVDSLIVATAVSQRAECIYSHDGGVKAFAQGFIEVKEIPFISTQTSAFKADEQDWGKPPKKMGEP